MADDCYPSGTPYPRECEINVQCSVCGHRFDVPGFHELGVYQTTNGEAECPECGALFET